MQFHSLQPIRPAEAVGHISRVLPFSVVDGPGSRLVVFLQGCNMRCGNCHNPHTIGLCNFCGECAAQCPNSAITMAPKQRSCDLSLCQSCDRCVEVCSRNGNPTAQYLPASKLVKRIAEDGMLLDGVTFSGGEATLQTPFLLELCGGLSHHPETKHLSRLLDSNGLVAESKWHSLLPKIDGVMLDIKAFDENTHRYLTGRSNRQVLASAELLAKADKLTELRWLIIEGVNDSDAEIAQMVALYQRLPNLPRLRLNRFHHHGIRPGFAAKHPPTSQARVDDIEAKLNQAGIETLVIRVD